MRLCKMFTLATICLGGVSCVGSGHLEVTAHRTPVGQFKVSGYVVPSVTSDGESFQVNEAYPYAVFGWQSVYWHMYNAHGYRIVAEDSNKPALDIIWIVGGGMTSVFVEQ